MFSPRDVLLIVGMLTGGLALAGRWWGWLGLGLLALAIRERGQQ